MYYNYRNELIDDEEGEEIILDEEEGEDVEEPLFLDYLPHIVIGILVVGILLFILKKK